MSEYMDKQRYNGKNLDYATNASFNKFAVSGDASVLATFVMFVRSKHFDMDGVEISYAP